MDIPLFFYINIPIAMENVILLSATCTILIRFPMRPRNPSAIQFEYLYRIAVNKKLLGSGNEWLSSVILYRRLLTYRYGNMKMTKLLEAHNELEVPLFLKRGGQVIHI